MNFQPLTINGKTIKLRITSRDHKELEMLLGCSIMTLMQAQDKMLDPIEPLCKMIYVANKYYAKQGEQPELTLDQVYDLYDAMIDEGFDVEKAIELLMQIGEVSGFFPKGTVEKMEAERQAELEAMNQPEEPDQPEESEKKPKV